MCCSLPVEQSSTALICKENVMEPVVLALASDERYFPGLYCAVASALSHLDVKSKVDLKVLDGGISGTSKDTLSTLVNRLGESVGLQFVTVDPAVFGKATPGPGQSHVADCRVVLPHRLAMHRLTYLEHH